MTDLIIWLYPLSKYKINQETVKNTAKKCNLEQACLTLIKEDCSYHFKIYIDHNYIFFGDIDHFYNPINEYFYKLIEFMKETCNIIIQYEDIKYTKNEGKNDSYHFAIPSLHLKCSLLYNIMNSF